MYVKKKKKKVLRYFPQVLRKNLRKGQNDDVVTSSNK